MEIRGGLGLASLARGSRPRKSTVGDRGNGVFSHGNSREAIQEEKNEPLSMYVGNFLSQKLVKAAWRCF